MQVINKFLKIDDPDLSPYELKRVQQLNLIAGYCILLGLVINTVNIIIDHIPNFFIMFGVSVVIFLPTILLQRNRHYIFARVYFCLLLFLAMILASIYHIRQGEFVHSENILLVLSPIFVILFDRNHKVWLYLSSMVAFYSIRVYDYQARGAELNSMFFISSIVYLIVFMAIYYFINSYMRAFSRVYAHQNHLIKQLDERKQRLEKTNSTKNKLFSIISNDLKRPVHMLSELLQVDDMLPQEELKKHKMKVKENVIRINSLIETVLAWAKSQLEGFKIQIEDIKLNELLANEVNNYQEQAKEKGIVLITDITHEIDVQSDPNHITLVIRNILNNCIKFTPKGGLISIYLKTDQYQSEILIKDTGIGMKKEDIDTILNGKLVQSSEGTEGESGSGLGLALCLETLEKISGTLFIESEESVGSIFTIHLPRTISSSQETSHQKAQISSETRP